MLGTPPNRMDSQHRSISSSHHKILNPINQTAAPVTPVMINNP